MNTIKRHGHRAAIALVVIGCGLTIAAWGSSSKPKAASRDHAILAFKRCMRAHGVSMDTGAGINSSSPSFKAARAACDKLLPGFAHAKAQMLKVSSACAGKASPDSPIRPSRYRPTPTPRERSLTAA